MATEAEGAVESGSFDPRRKVWRAVKDRAEYMRPQLYFPQLDIQMWSSETLQSGQMAFRVPKHMTKVRY